MEGRQNIVSVNGYYCDREMLLKAIGDGEHDLTFYKQFGQDIQDLFDASGFLPRMVYAVRDMRAGKFPSPMTLQELCVHKLVLLSQDDSYPIDQLQLPAALLTRDPLSASHYITYVLKGTSYSKSILCPERLGRLLMELVQCGAPQSNALILTGTSACGTWNLLARLLLLAVLDLWPELHTLEIDLPSVDASRMLLTPGVGPNLRLTELKLLTGNLTGEDLDSIPNLYTNLKILSLDVRGVDNACTHLVKCVNALPLLRDFSFMIEVESQTATFNRLLASPAGHRLHYLDPLNLEKTNFQPQYQVNGYYQLVRAYFYKQDPFKCMFVRLTHVIFMAPDSTAGHKFRHKTITHLDLFSVSAATLLTLIGDLANLEHLSAMVLRGNIDARQVLALRQELQSLSLVCEHVRSRNTKRLMGMQLPHIENITEIDLSFAKEIPNGLLNVLFGKRDMKRISLSHYYLRGAEIALLKKNTTPQNHLTVLKLVELEIEDGASEPDGVTHQKEAGVAMAAKVAKTPSLLEIKFSNTYRDFVPVNNFSEILAAFAKLSGK